METYFYFFSMLLIVLLLAKIDANQIKENKVINHRQEFLFFCIISLFSFVILYKENHFNFFKWSIYCGVTCLLLRGGFYDFSLNLFRGKSIWYISKNADGVYNGTQESLYDDILSKFKINANYVRVLLLALSIAWLFLHNKLL